MQRTDHLECMDVGGDAEWNFWKLIEIQFSFFKEIGAIIRLVLWQILASWRMLNPSSHYWHNHSGELKPFLQFPPFETTMLEVLEVLHDIWHVFTLWTSTSFYEPHPVCRTGGYIEYWSAIASHPKVPFWQNPFQPNSKIIPFRIFFKSAWSVSSVPC